MKHLRTAVAALFALSLLASPAMAASASADFGSAWSSGSILNVRDGKADNRSVYAVYIKKGAQEQSTLYNQSGYNTTVTKNVGATVTSVKICLNKWGRDTCSGWG